MPSFDQILLRKLAVHSDLGATERAALAGLPFRLKDVGKGSAIIRQGADPDVSVIVVAGMLARYQTLDNGRRQYISFHVAGDWPDAQSLFIEKMDHAVCAMSAASIALVRHEDLLRLFERLPDAGIAIWRETLIDAAIFRQTIVNNSAQPTLARLAHFLCEQFYKARSVGLIARGGCFLPLSQQQLGETLGISVVTANRAVRGLTALNLIRWTDATLTIRDWGELCALGRFNPSYMHVKRRRRKP